MAQSSGVTRAEPMARAVTSVAGFARRASVELNVHELKDLAAGRELLPADAKVYISHLPKQAWADTLAASERVRAAGLDPVPHIPVRLLSDRTDAERLIAALIERARVAELLLIAGDHAQPRGAYPAVLELLQTGLLQSHGIRRVSFAAHPEGHPVVALDDTRKAAIDKAQWARQAGLAASFVTQFCFESEPFVTWANDARDRGIQARLIAGVAGPASIAKLVRFAVQCGVGRSMRALSARPGVMTRLMEEHGPERLLDELVQAKAPLDGIHLFGFGGFLRTCRWLRRAAAGEFDAPVASALGAQR
jgi:methylenetetrahydrofolate reductase (NADPH)